MLRQRTYLFCAVFVLALALSGCSFSLAEDILPPANYVEPAAETIPTQSEAAQFPLVPPDPAAGAQIFTESCAPCHGAKGMGDGERAAQLPNQPAQLGNPELARAARPVDWYEMVTRGNLERFMPGFASLNDRQRWDVVAYALTLSVSPEQLAEGKTLYEQNCAQCHGLTGRGDGELAAELQLTPANWTDQERLAGLSASDMAAVMEGEREGHPDLTVRVDAAQGYEVAAYVRSLSFARAGEESAQSADESGESQPTLEASPTAAIGATITITGKISNASASQNLPAGMTVTVQAYNQMMRLAFEVSGDVAQDGAYEIKDVEYDPNYVYFAQVTANGLTFNSDILHGGDISGAVVDLPIEIYDTTTDQSALRADRLHVFLDFSQPGRVQVVNLYIFSNLGDKVVGPAEKDGPVLRFDLPAGAQNLQFQDGELGGRFIQTESGFADRMSIAPGVSQQQILFAYELPYDRKLDLDMQLPLDVEAAIVMAPPSGVKIKSDQLLDAGQRDVQGTAYQMYQSAGELKKGSTLRISLSGKVGGAADSDAATYVMIGAAGLGAVLAGLGLWLYRMRKQAEPVEEAVDADAASVADTSDALIEAIVVLDDRHASGDLSEAAYQARRAELKARLAEVMKRES